jgi:glycosyltransferase involved in cell wall biosynthesis
MISFIVIGRNESWKLTNCLQSVYKAIKHNNLDMFEVIYVDSKSTDDSIDRAKNFEDIKIFQITGECNAAIARNIGAKESIGDIMVFLDGDMEIQSAFIQHILINSHRLKSECLTGHIDDVFYDIKDKYLSTRPRTYKAIIPITEQELNTNGGLLVINRNIWVKAGGMRNKYRRNEDNDLTIRLKKIGVNTIRLPFLAARHHTVDYRNERRMWKGLFSGDYLYPAVTARDHFNVRSIQYKTLRCNYTAVLLLLTIVTLLINTTVFCVMFMVLLLITLTRVILNTRKAAISNSKNIVIFVLERFVFQIIRDALFILAYLFFYPQNHQAKYAIHN